MATKKTTTKKTAAKKTAAKAAKKAPAKAAKKAPAKAAKKAAAKMAKKSAKAGARKASAVEETAAVVEASPSEVAAMAYQIYLVRIAKGIPGDALSDWVAAEQRLRAN